MVITWSKWSFDVVWTRKCDVFISLSLVFAGARWKTVILICVVSLVMFPEPELCKGSGTRCKCKERNQEMPKPICVPFLNCSVPMGTCKRNFFQEWNFHVKYLINHVYIIFSWKMSAMRAFFLIHSLFFIN